MTLIMPGDPVERAIKAASLRLEENFKVRMANKEQELRTEYEARLAHERSFADIGRTVVRTLRSKGVNLANAPTPGTDVVCARYATMGKDFDTLMSAVKNDVMLSSEWNRFSMMLRLAQEDDNGQEE
jgi:hypothetical protein